MSIGRIAVSLGDPAGIGPEIVAKALLAKESLRKNTILVGNRTNFRQTLRTVGLEPNFIDELNFHDVPGKEIHFGLVQEAAGKIALDSIYAAVDLALSGEAVAICTAPINKESIISAGSQDIDHTTLLARITKARRVSTVFESGRLRILFASKHVPILDAIKSINVRSVQDSIDLAQEALRLLGIKRQRIAVAALNPHAGESGLIGREEIEVITPAINSRKGLLDVTGPYPADSIYYRASKGEFDIVVSLYHDQGHIAAKMLDFHGTISMNLGLPFLRTSVDHGTAFEIAGRNLAIPKSMISAIEVARKYASSYKRNYQKLSAAAGEKTNFGK